MKTLLTVAAVLVFLAADLRLRLLTKKYISLILMLVVPHIVLICNAALYPEGYQHYRIPAAVICLYFFISMMLYSYPVKIQCGKKLRIMMGGRRIFLLSITAAVLQAPLCVLEAVFHDRLQVSTSIVIADIITVYSLLFILFLNGAVRIFFTSRRLGVTKRVLLVLFWWVPGLNIILGLWFGRIVKQEFRHGIVKAELENARAGSDICKTKYPLLLLHGIGFRDYKYLNYWGRIPALLIKNGATVYYGHQQAWGTIESNAGEIKTGLLEILSETGCDRVNIIAHSKGGLDARYLISSLGMAGQTASLTTIATPHRGSELVDVLMRMKESRYRKICDMIDRYFKKIGDTSPDAFVSSRQLAPAYCAEFNIQNPDSPEVYYQSYASQMKSSMSHFLLGVPFAVMKWVSGDNDGLVSVDSAKWGEFRGVLKSGSGRGISHADLIDLMHQDYEGFDIAEEYVSIVKELKDKGY